MPTPFKKAIQSFPTPDLRDLYFVEFVDPNAPGYRDLEYGTLYPDQTRYPLAKLTYKSPIETQEGMDKRIRRVWCAARNAQDVYNARVTYSGEAAAFPIFTRNYLEARGTYARRAALSALGSIISLTLVAGGTNYVGDSFGHVALIFAGGAGSGAAGFGIVESGIVTACYLTNGGTGYMSAPTVSAASGAGLNITAAIQPTTALLVHEEDRSAEGDLAGLFVQVARVYETLPGPEVYTPGQDEETGALERHYEQRVVTGTAIKIQGTQYPAASGYYVVDSKLVTSTDDENVGVLKTHVMQKPDDRVEYIKGNFPVPSVVESGAAPFWAVPPIAADIPPGPYQGFTYLLTTHAPASPLKVTFSYAIPGTAIPFSPVSPVDASLACYNVISNPSRFLPIGSNTIHRDYTITATTGPTVVEVLPASVPATYASGNHVIDVEQIKWKGPFERRAVIVASFPAPSISP